jgi:hypothetical protein
MKSIKYIVAGLVAAGLTASSYATITVNWGTAGSTFFTDSTGAAGYLGGDLIEIGTFASAPTVGSASLSGFSVFGTATTGTAGNAGVLPATASAGTAGTTFTHNQIYIVAFNAATAGAATQEGIFYVNDTTGLNWKFPGDADFPNNTTIDAQDLMVGGTGVLAPGATIVFGGKGTDGSGPYSLLETAPVPEPSSIGLVFLGLLGAFGMIRRRRS